MDMSPATKAAPTMTGLFAPDGRIGRSADAVLHAARLHLGMDVGFIVEFLNDGTRIFRYVDCEAADRCPVHQGDIVPLVEGYCQRVIDGELPQLIADTSRVPAAMELPATRRVPIGAHLSVPIRLEDGRVYGTFCCFSFRPDPTLNERDLGMMQALAQLVAQLLDIELAATRTQEAATRRIEAAIAQGQPVMMYQPIYCLEGELRLCGVECLARFRIEPLRGPDKWFAEAMVAGLGPRLEIAAIRTALTELAGLEGDFYVAVNCSPQTVLSGELAAALQLMPAERLVLEITEHAYVEDYATLLQCLNELRAQGVRLAIDDAGAGYASLQHILSLQPDFIKLDISLTRSINSDRMRHALAGSLVEFARRTDSIIVAEGVETDDEMHVLRALGVQRAQGYYMSMPLPLSELLTLLKAA